MIKNLASFFLSFLFSVPACWGEELMLYPESAENVGFGYCVSGIYHQVGIFKLIGQQDLDRDGKGELTSLGPMIGNDAVSALGYDYVILARVRGRWILPEGFSDSEARDLADDLESSDWAILGLPTRQAGRKAPLLLVGSDKKGYVLPAASATAFRVEYATGSLSGDFLEKSGWVGVDIGVLFPD
ncbi:MAG: hypothetical protein PF961_11895 [Planctomycetota bacterium]|jgi:hypothetical protein|nr:hypothetical protein [Planctomycetota bacterium]